jgi:integrase/recombinase XerC
MVEPATAWPRRVARVVSYADRTRRPPNVLSDAEQTRLLKISGQHAEDFRDHMIFSLALGCALREHEIVALDVRDVADERGLKAKRAIDLRVFKGSRREKGVQRVHVPDGTYYKLEKYLRARFLNWKPMATEPLFPTRQSARLSTRRLREMFAEWQQRAGFDHHYKFHALRHTSLTNVYRATKNIRLVQRVARHASLNTTVIYEHASDGDVAAAVRGLAS